MSKPLRTYAVQFALVAMLLRALVPAGWMPVASQGVPLVVCTAQGLQTIDIGTHKPADHAPARTSHDVCPFAAAASLAPPQSEAVLSQPALIASAVALSLTEGRPQATTQFHPQSPRAPPATA